MIRKYTVQGLLTVAFFACFVGVLFGFSNLIRESSVRKKVSVRTLERQFDEWQTDNLPERVSSRRLVSCVPIWDAGLYLNPECPVCRMEMEACASLVSLAGEPLERRKWQMIQEEAELYHCDSLVSAGTASRLDSAACDLHREKLDILSRMDSEEVDRELLNSLAGTLAVKREKLQRLAEKDGYRIEFSVLLHEGDSTAYTISFVKGVDDDGLTFVGFKESL